MVGHEACGYRSRVSVLLVSALVAERAFYLILVPNIWRLLMLFFLLLWWWCSFKLL